MVCQETITKEIIFQLKDQQPRSCTDMILQHLYNTCNPIIIDILREANIKRL